MMTKSVMLVSAVALAAALAGTTIWVNTARPVDEATHRTSNGHAQVDVTTGQIVLPLDTYGLSDGESRSVDLAINRLTARCMAEKGEHLDVVDRTNQPIPTDLRYGIWRPDETDVYGYAHPQTDADRRAEAINGEQMPPSRLTALRECTLHPAISAFGLETSLAQILGLRTYRDLLRSSAGQSIIGEWRDCLQETGVALSADPRSLWTPEGAMPTGTPISMATAATDVRCKVKVKLVKRLAALEAGLQAQVIKLHREKLLAQRAHYEQVVARARAANAAG